MSGKHACDNNKKKKEETKEFVQYEKKQKMLESSALRSVSDRTSAHGGAGGGE